MWGPGGGSDLDDKAYLHYPSTQVCLDFKLGARSKIIQTNICIILIPFLPVSFTSHHGHSPEAPKRNPATQKSMDISLPRFIYFLMRV